MLHELSHNVYGPHDAKFHALWDQLRDEYEGLVRKGYTGEGFLSDGKRLGGRSVPRDEARRIARNAAERRRTLYSGSGQKLGGAPVREGVDIRDVIVGAVERRTTVLQGCGSGGKKNDQEVKELVDQATNNGFRTKADEDIANDRAIAQALWELVQEDEKEKYGKAYVPPTPANPTGNGGRKLDPSSTREKRPASSFLDDGIRRTAGAPSGHDRQSPRHVSRLVKEQPSGITSLKTSMPSPTKSSETPMMASKTEKAFWECPVCTCHNHINFLCCDACTSERPEHITAELASRQTRPPIPTSSKPQTWTCHQCTTVMENKWWTCNVCGTMKASS